MYPHKSTTDRFFLSISKIRVLFLNNYRNVILLTSLILRVQCSNSTCFVCVFVTLQKKNT